MSFSTETIRHRRMEPDTVTRRPACSTFRKSAGIRHSARHLPLRLRHCAALPSALVTEGSTSPPCFIILEPVFGVALESRSLSASR